MGGENIDINSKIKEAEAYHTHGLYQESLGIYEHILSTVPELDPTIEESVQEKILLLQEAIRNIDQEEPDLAAQDISQIKTTWSTENVHEIYDSASAFKELGLFREAIEEYSKLFSMDYPAAKIVPELMECLFETHSPSRVIDQIEKIVEENDLGDEVKADIKFRLGMEMEKRDYNDLALEFYESVKKIDPGYKGIQAQIDLIQQRHVYKSKYDYLLESNLVSSGQLQQALNASKASKKSVEKVLMEQMGLKKEEIGKSLSLFYKVPFQSFDSDMPIPYELLSKIKKAFLLKNIWVPLNWELSEGVVDILIDDPSDITKTDNISALIRAKKINLLVGFKEDIEAAIKHFYSDKESDSQTIDEGNDDDFYMMPDVDFEEEEDFEEEIEEFDESSSQIVRLVDQILISAYRKNASDIHIEPSAVTKRTSVRYRIDGVCQEVLQVPNANAKGILSRLKIMSGLDIAEKRLPQDGKIKFKRKGVKSFELRVATLPTAGGFEDSVLRILAESGAMALDNMGMNERNLGILQRVISEPYGLVLVVGPTGSGKTTTLHAALGHINKPGIKIWTAEDPVEITQQGLRQVECKPKIGLDFARVMRAFLRADPDVIMIGEMRDHETASIGVEASLTGHLVFSTLHTNSAPETVTRLLDMGLNPLNFSDAFLGVLAQRLVRRLCKKCQEEYKPSQEELDEIVKDYGKEKFAATGIAITPELLLYRSEGCEACSGSGYKGRLGIHELMEGTKEIKRMIKKEATSEELFMQAATEGMTTIKQDGIAKVFQGLTDMKEIRRVCVG